MRYQRLVTVANTSMLSELSRRLWQGARLVTQKLDTDLRVRLGTWAQGTHKAPLWLPDIGELQAFLEARAAMPEEDVRNVLRCFHPPGTCKTWLINYLVPDSSHIAHGVEIDTPMGKVTLQGNPMSEAQQQLMMQEEQWEQPKWWRWYMGSLLGGETALAVEQARLTPGNLANLLGTSPDNIPLPQDRASESSRPSKKSKGD